MTSLSFTSYISKNKIYVTNENENWNIILLNLVWCIKIETEINCLTIHPDKIISAQLNYIEAHETKTIELNDWVFEINKVEERPSPFQFYIFELELDFKNKKLIASL